MQREFSNPPLGPATPPETGSPEPCPHAPQLLRFGLRQLLIVVTLSTVLAAVMAKLGGIWPWVIGGCAAMIAAHVLGTLLGTRLRDTSHDVQKWRAAADPGEPDLPRISTNRHAAGGLARTTSLAERHTAPLRDRAALAAGVAAGFLLGAVAIWFAWGDRVSWIAVLVGAASSGVLGGWIALVATSFTAIARQAIRHAHEDLAIEQDRRRAAYQRKEQANLEAAAEDCGPARRGSTTRVSSS